MFGLTCKDDVVHRLKVGLFSSPGWFLATNGDNLELIGQYPKFSKAVLFFFGMDGRLCHG